MTTDPRAPRRRHIPTVAAYFLGIGATAWAMLPGNFWGAQRAEARSVTWSVAQANMHGYEGGRADEQGHGAWSDLAEFRDEVFNFKEVRGAPMTVISMNEMCFDEYVAIKDDFESIGMEGYFSQSKKLTDCGGKYGNALFVAQTSRQVATQCYFKVVAHTDPVWPTTCYDPAPSMNTSTEYRNAVVNRTVGKPYITYGLSTHLINDSSNKARASGQSKKIKDSFGNSWTGGAGRIALGDFNHQEPSVLDLWREQYVEGVDAKFETSCEWWGPICHKAHHFDYIWADRGHMRMAQGNVWAYWVDDHKALMTNYYFK